MFTKLGVRWRLLGAFLGVSALAALAAGAGIYALDQVATVLEKTINQRTPAALAALELSRQAERIAAAAPTLLAAQTQKDRTDAATFISGEVDRMEGLLTALKARSAGAGPLSGIESAVVGLRQNLQALDGVVFRQLSAADRKRELLGRLTGLSISGQRLLQPAVLVLETQVTALRRATSGQSEAVGAPPLSDVVEAIAANMTMQKAQVDLTALNEGLLKAAVAQTAPDLPLLARPLQRSLASLNELLPAFDARLKSRLGPVIEGLAQLTQGADAIPDARAAELAIAADGERLLSENATLSKELTRSVDTLVAAADDDIRAAGQDALTVQRLGKKVLLATVLLSLISSGLIVWLYVERSLVARLKALSSSMLAVAGGNLRVPLPEPRGGDEIAEMTRALVVFRDTAVEIETNNLREIALTRQRLVEAIESISEGFALYDAQDLLVLCNRRYREVASPADPEAIVPGLTFESVIRRVAALGAVDTEGHRNEDWVTQRRAAHREGSSMLYEHRGRWLQVSERPAGNGGLVVVWTDVTALKQGEILLREAFDRINQELAAARQLQLSMVPRHFPAWSEAQPIEIQAVMEPAREVGGDLYDFFLAAPGKFCFVVGDVSGKGTAAALFMARTRSLVRATVALWRQTAGAVPAPSAVLQAVNRELCLDNSARMFVTVFLATLDLATGELAYANAGHPAPYRMSPGSPPVAIPAPADAPLGIRSEAKFLDRSMALREHEALCLVTDGVLDALNPSEQFFGKDRLTHTLAGLDGDAPSAIVSGVLKAIDEFADGTPRFDDVTLLALRWSRSAPLEPDAGNSAAQSKAL